MSSALSDLSTLQDRFQNQDLTTESQRQLLSNDISPSTTLLLNELTCNRHYFLQQQNQLRNQQQLAGKESLPKHLEDLELQIPQQPDTTQPKLESW